MRLIDADAFRRELDNHWPFTKEEQSKHGFADMAKSTVLFVLNKMPTIEERKNGEWIERNPQNSDTCRLIECDQCGFSHIVGFNVPYEHWIENRNFCERCGADMRKGEGEKE